VKAAVCNQFNQPLTIENVELDPPADGEVSVRVAACGVCHSDLSFVEGAWDGPLPAVYGHEVAGVVTDVGASVDSVKPGDHAIVTLIRSCGRCYFCVKGEVTQCAGVFDIDQRSPLRLADGAPVRQGLRVAGFAEHVTVHGSQVVRIPGDVPMDSACLLACAVATGYGAVHNTAQVPAGASVAVVGAGGVGLNAIQGAAIASARPVIAVDISDSRLEAAAKFGASHVVNSKSEDAREAAKRVTDGRGADFVFVTSGATAAIEIGMRLSRRGGTVVIVGMTPIGVTVAVDSLEFADRALRMLGSKMGATRPQIDMPVMVELYQSGKLKLDELVTGRFGLDQINEAMATTRRGEGLRTVIVF
jgi:S-(hydroxymethyl)glutathione dehydrogenase / alcohol dehydrogenase